MSVIHFSADKRRKTNPLDEMEDLLDASDYEYVRATDTRLSFECESKQATYHVFLEWHTEFEAIRCSIILKQTQKIDRTIIDVAIENANQAAWHGFFVIDGVGNTIFKTLVPIKNQDMTAAIGMIEDKIDNGIEDMDRLVISLGLTKSEDDAGNLFADEEWNIENLALMFSDPKGNA